MEEEALTKIWSWKSSVWSSGAARKTSSNLKTLHRGLKKISTYRTNLIISRTRMFNHASLALQLNAQNANGSTIDALAKTSYFRTKGKASTDTGEANSKRYVHLLIFFI